MIFLSSEETRSVSDWPSAIECMRAVYEASPEPGGTPGRLVATSGNGSLRCMPAIPPAGRLLGTKQLVKTRDGRVSYLISLFDRASGELVFLVDGLAITAMRTAATTTAALNLLDGPREIDLAVLGSGLEATMHIEALAGAHDPLARRLQPDEGEARRLREHMGRRARHRCLEL